MIKVALREIRRDERSFLFWTLGVLFLIVATVAKTGAMMEDGAVGLTGMIMIMPKVLQNLFGLGVVDLSKPIGLFAMILLYIAMIVCYHAASLGAGAFAREERDRTFEFLYVRPIGRGGILLGKVLAGFVELVALNLIAFAACGFSISFMGGETGNLDQMFLGLLIMQVFFYAAGLLASLSVRTMKLAVSISSALVTALFLLAMAVDLAPVIGFLGVLTPFKAFDAKLIYQSGINAPACAAWIALAVLLNALSFALHRRRDLHT